MVFVLDKHKHPLMPCTEKRARLLLERQRAVVHKMAPFTIRLKDRWVADSAFQPLRLKLDPGSKTTGSALLLEGTQGAKAIFLGEIMHKVGIKAKLDARRALRRGRRQRQTRYRPARFQNRRRPDGWLPPSLTARVNQTLHVVAKMCRLAPITALSVEHVAFDTQKMQNPEISGVEYQQGTLLGYEVREYLLEKWHRACAYCGQTQVPLEVEHIVPKSRGGSSRISNLTLACHDCNQAKNTRTAEEFGYPTLQAQARKPLEGAAFMTTTRWRLYTQLQATGLPVEGGSGGRTKKQRTAHGLPKEHYFDALCVGKSTPDQFASLVSMVQVWTATGRGTRQMCRTNAYGFPIAHRFRRKIHFGFQTGDLIKAVVPRGKYAGTWVGRVLTRATGRFDISAHGQRIAQGISYNYCHILQRQNGCSARLKWLLPNGSPLPSPRLKPGASRGRLVNWVAYGWEHLSREAVRLRFSNAPRTDDFREWQDWLADLDPTEQADLQDLAHAEWATHGSEPLSLETVRRQFPGAPRTDRWPNGKSG